MKIPKERCAHCHQWFSPYPPKRDLQTFCSKASCQKERHRQNSLTFHRDNPDWDDSRRIKIKDWVKSYPDYWRHYRATHPAYARREAARMSSLRQGAETVAKRDSWRDLYLGELRDIQAQASPAVAKRDSCHRRVDRILTCLIRRETSQNETLAGPATV